MQFKIISLPSFARILRRALSWEVRRRSVGRVVSVWCAPPSLPPRPPGAPGPLQALHFTSSDKMAEIRPRRENAAKDSGTQIDAFSTIIEDFRIRISTIFFYCGWSLKFCNILYLRVKGSNGSLLLRSHCQPVASDLSFSRLSLYLGILIS